MARFDLLFLAYFTVILSACHSGRGSGTAECREGLQGCLVKSAMRFLEDRRITIDEEDLKEDYTHSALALCLGRLANIETLTNNDGLIAVLSRGNFTTFYFEGPRILVPYDPAISVRGRITLILVDRLDTSLVALMELH